MTVINTYDWMKRYQKEQQYPKGITMGYDNISSPAQRFATTQTNAQKKNEYQQ